MWSLVTNKTTDWMNGSFRYRTNWNTKNDCWGKQQSLQINYKVLFTQVIYKEIIRKTPSIEIIMELKKLEAAAQEKLY